MLQTMFDQRYLWRVVNEHSLEMTHPRQQPINWGFPVSIAVKHAAKEELNIINADTLFIENELLPADLKGLLTPAVKLVVDNDAGVEHSNTVEPQYFNLATPLSALAEQIMAFNGPMLPLLWGPAAPILEGPIVPFQIADERAKAERSAWIEARVRFPDSSFIGAFLPLLEGPVQPLLVGPLHVSQVARFLFSEVGQQRVITSHKNPFLDKHWLLLDRPFTTRWYETKQLARQALEEAMNQCNLNYACEAEYLEHHQQIADYTHTMYAAQAAVGIYCREVAHISREECFAQLSNLDDVIKPAAIGALELLQAEHTADHQHHLATTKDFADQPYGMMGVALLILLALAMQFVVIPEMNHYEAVHEFAPAPHKVTPYVPPMEIAHVGH